MHTMDFGFMYKVVCVCREIVCSFYNFSWCHFSCRWAPELLVGSKLCVVESLELRLPHVVVITGTGRGQSHPGWNREGLDP